jgi:type I restriction enzyme S subunit
MQILTLNASKKTKSTLVGEIPVDWGCVKLSQVIAGLEAGVSVSSSGRPAADGEPGVLKVNSVSNGRFIPTENKAIIPIDVPRAHIRPRVGAVLVSRSNSPELVGDVALVRDATNNLFLPDKLWQVNLNCHAEVSEEWLVQILRSPEVRLEIRNRASGTSQSMKNISQAAFLAIRVPLPPLAEQRKIADVLSTWDDALEKLDMLIEAKERRKAALAQSLLGGKRRLKGFSRRWKTLQLAEHIHFSPRQVQKPSKPFKSLGIRSHGKGTFIKPDFEPSKIALDELYEVRAGDLIVNITFAWEGAITVAGEEADGALVSHRFPTFTFIPGKSTASYLRHVIGQKWFRDKLILVSPGGAGRNRVMNKRDFLTIQIPTPPYDEQLRIGGILDTCDEEIRLLRAEYEALGQQKRGLMQRLLAGKIRV